MPRITLAIACTIASLALTWAFGIIAPSSASAQTIPGISDPLTLSLIPEVPQPNGLFDVRLQSYSMGLDSALVVWSIDGKEVQRGVGLKSLSARAGGVGSMSTIHVSVVTVGTGTFNTSIVIRPADVALVWESDTYTPPFYKGKALHSYNGAFKVIALPEFVDFSGKRINPKELIYSWSKNGEVQANASGYGKNTFITSQTSYLRPGEDIMVEVSAPRDNIVARRSVTISPIVPKIVFYENSGLYGTLYEKSLLRSVNLVNDEVEIVAEPYFFSVPVRNSAALSYSWKLNGQTVPSFQNRSGVILRKTGQAGASSIGVTIQNSQKLLQGANSAIIIRYE
ncbi:MAG: hypothetical protein Q8L64_06475 [bacterium]|nr:hypothetical protein [bacterium]